MSSNEKTKINDTPSKQVNSFQDIDKLFSDDDTTEMYYQSQSYEVVSLMMYLTGVDRKNFSDHIPDLSKQYEKFDQNKNSRIIRNLCIVRTSLLTNFSGITRSLVYDMKSLSEMPEYIPSESVTGLEKEGIIIQSGKPDINNYIVKINTEISNRVNDVRPLFPEWVNWDYIRPLFLMPKGFKPENIKGISKSFNSNRTRYPFQVWLNWDYDNSGTLFVSDSKFISRLYKAHGDSFEDKSLITGTDKSLLVNLYDFINSHKKILIVVDCENSDPVKLAAALLSLDGSQTSSVEKIIYFDSANTTPAWETLCSTGITKQFESEHNVVSTLYEHKSQVDMELAIRVTKEVYTNSVDAVILVSSDSDYWTLIRNMPETDFLVMLEEMKSGRVIRDTLEKEGYQYCFIDDFCTARSYSIKTDTILNSLQKQIDETVNFNIREMLEDKAKISWLTLSKKEEDNLFDRYLKTMRLKIQEDGTVRIIITK